MVDYQGNTDKSKIQKPPDKQIEKVVTGDVVQRPKTIGRRFKDIFFGGDIKVAAKYVAADVLLPALRNLIVDATSKGIERIVYGEAGYRRRSYEYRPRIQYNNPIYRDPRDVRTMPARLPDQRPYRDSYRNETDIILSSRADAERVLEQLIAIVEQYDVASKADLYELIGLPSTPIDNKWGWTYLTNVSIRQVRDGYVIDLPALEAV